MADSGSSRRVVVTGIGVVTPIGHTVGDFWEAVKQGKSGVGPIERGQTVRGMIAGVEPIEITYEE